MQTQARIRTWWWRLKEQRIWKPFWEDTGTRWQGQSSTTVLCRPLPRGLLTEAWRCPAAPLRFFYIQFLICFLLLYIFSDSQASIQVQPNGSHRKTKNNKSIITAAINTVPLHDWVLKYTHSSYCLSVYIVLCKLMITHLQYLVLFCQLSLVRNQATSSIALC